MGQVWILSGIIEIDLIKLGSFIKKGNYFILHKQVG